MNPEEFPGQRLARWFSLVAVAVVLYGLAAAHVPFLIGTPWTTCKMDQELPCVLAFHLYEVPIVLFQAGFAWYGLARLTRATVGTYRVLLSGSTLLNAVFGLFETTLLLDTIKAGGPTWEALALTSLVVFFQVGVFFGLFLLNKLPR